MAQRKKVQFYHCACDFTLKKMRRNVATMCFICSNYFKKYLQFLNFYTHLIFTNEQFLYCECDLLQIINYIY